MINNGTTYQCLTARIRQTDRQTDRETTDTGRKSDRQRRTIGQTDGRSDRQKDRQTDRDRQIETDGKEERQNFSVLRLVGANHQENNK